MSISAGYLWSEINSYIDAMLTLEHPLLQSRDCCSIHFYPTFLIEQAKAGKTGCIDKKDRGPKDAESFL